MISMGGFSPSSTKILQRALRAAVTVFLLFILIPAGFAQSTGKKTSRGPRAIAIVEWTPSGPHLIPVSIMIDGKFYDAGLYLANPVPMALETGNVYEIQKSGDPAGLFTVNSVMQLQASNTFYGVGKITSQADVEAAAKKAAAAKAAAAARTPSRLSSEDSGPPRLRRAGGHGGSPGGSPKNGPPVPQTSPEPPSSPPDNTGDDSDPDRPTLKRPPPPPSETPTASPTSTTASTTAPVDDSDRPVLKHGTGGQQAVSLTGPVVPKGPAAAAKPTAPEGHNRLEVAVSDANTTQPHTFKWIGKPDYEQRDQQATEQLALQTVRDYAAKHPGLRPGTTLEDLQVHAFDLDYTNTPIFVLTATVPQVSAPTPRSRTAKPKAVAAQEPLSVGPKNEFYVTVVARENYDGTMRKVFASVTDNTHLDVYPKLELIDAVDADGIGRGELLFRQTSDSGRSYAIYRVGVESITALYNSGAPLEQ